MSAAANTCPVAIIMGTTSTCPVCAQYLLIAVCEDNVPSMDGRVYALFLHCTRFILDN